MQLERRPDGSVWAVLTEDNVTVEESLLLDPEKVDREGFAAYCRWTVVPALMKKMRRAKRAASINPDHDAEGPQGG